MSKFSLNSFHVPLLLNYIYIKISQYHLKGIRNYNLLQLVEKIEIFIKRMRWKAIMYDTGCKQNGNVEMYWLKTLRSPKQVKELSAFEKDLISVVKEIKFKNARSDF